MNTSLTVVLLKLFSFHLLLFFLFYAWIINNWIFIIFFLLIILHNCLISFPYFVLLVVDKLLIYYSIWIFVIIFFKIFYLFWSVAFLFFYFLICNWKCLEAHFFTILLFFLIFVVGDRWDTFSFCIFCYLFWSFSLNSINIRKEFANYILISFVHWL